MGFLLRSAFWLGLVFHAMPLGDAQLSDAVPAARDALAAGMATQAGGGGAASAIARAVLRTALEPQPTAPTRPRRVPSRRPRRSAPRSTRSPSATACRPGAAAARHALSGGPRGKAGPRRAKARYNAGVRLADERAADHDRSHSRRFRLPRRLGGPLSLRHRARPHAGAAERGRAQRRQQGARLRQPGVARARDAPDAAGRTVLHFRGDSDSHLVRGLVAIAIALFSDRRPRRFSRPTPRRPSANSASSSI